MVKQITLTIGADGSVNAVAHGRQGKKCVDDLTVISGLVGESVILDSSLTDEYNYQTFDTEIQIDQDWAK